MSDERPTKSNKTVVWTIVAHVLLVLLLGFIFATIYETFAIMVYEKNHETPVDAPNSPLDRLTYKAPIWSSTKESYKIVDRNNGREWWLVRVDDTWVTLDISDMEAAR